ncbi:MAG: FtsX-like permease family protein, partial [Candidatus Limnocylindrales bacterium]
TAALFDQDRSLLVLAAVVIAVAAVAVGIHPALRGAIKPRTLLLTLGPVLAVLAWDAVTRGPLSGEALASQASGPLLTIAPALLAFSVILVCVTLVPMLFRGLARLSIRFPVSMRLSLHSLARDSDQPAAALTLLTVSLAAICFGLGYSATLRQGATDQAAYATGMDLRVTELGASSSRLQSVAPIARYTEAAPDAETFPVVRADMAVASGLDVDLVGLQPDALPLLRGWRPDFSDRSPADLAAAIETPGEWTLAGHPITADGSVTVTYESTGDPVRLAGVVAHPGGEFTYLTFGDLDPGRNTAIGYTEDERSYLGAKLIALVLTNGGPSAAVGGPSAGLPQHALVTFEGLEDITGPGMVDLEVSGATGARYIRPPQPSDGLVLPAIVSPDLAALASADGRITLQNPQGDPYPVRVAAIANNFPTLQRLGRAFAIVDIDPVLVAINATLPGTGFPTEVWVRTPTDARAAELATVFSQWPFRYPEVQLRTDLEAVRVADPFSEGVVRALLLAALAGLALAIIGVVMAAFVHLRDETGELGELEAQGVAPATLARVVLVRTAILGVGGVLLGVALGVGLNHVATSFLALSADAVRAIPPLVVIESWAIVAVTGAAVLAVVTVLVATIATRRFRGDVRART